MKHVISTVMILLSVIAIAQESTNLRQEEFNLDHNVAIEGYDPVSYFTQKEPTKGMKTISTIYNGVTYNFANEEDKTKFLESPSKYEPQYGGWCAYAMGDDGTKVSINPKSYKIVDGKLYLFYHTIFANTLKSWNENEAVLKNNADKNWNKTTKN